MTQGIFFAMSCCVLLMSSNASAAVWRGESLPRSIMLGGKRLTLNGMGSRRATLLNVRVYRAGLYVEEPSSDPNAILASNDLKAIEMKFARDVPRDKLMEAWDESYRKNCADACGELSVPYNQLKTLMEDMKKGDTMSLIFRENEVEIQIKDRPSLTIPGSRFSDALLATWLGRDPADSSLKESLLAFAPGRSESKPS